MDEKILADTARRMVAPGRGILAADESTGTIKKRFDSISVENTEENRRAYRELLFTTAGAEDYVSGAILFEETLFQSSADGTPFPQLLNSKGIIPGIKVDKGAKPLAGFPGETVTEGLDGLRERLESFREAGARFAKWRAVIAIGENMPSDCAIDVNAHALARYAALCQEANVTPIVEPEVLMDGDNSIEVCEAVTTRVLDATFAALRAQRVLLEAASEAALVATSHGILHFMHLPSIFGGTTACPVPCPRSSSNAAFRLQSCPRRLAAPASCRARPCPPRPAPTPATLGGA